ncbi:MAG: hypothetical protein IKH01_09210 [Prevotella sp.]|nr:hypothetical protein [Prevotella sp.]
MKKTILFSIMLTAAFAANAQLKVSPKMTQGDQKNYASTTVINIPGQGTVTISDESSISVAEVLSDGFVLSYETNKVTTDAKADNVIGQIMAAAQEVMMGSNVRIVTDKDGKPLRLDNFDVVKQQVAKKADAILDQMLKAAPQLGQMMSRDDLRNQILENITADNILKSMQNITSPIALNGKTVMTGAQEDFVNEQGLKLKRMYFVNGNKVTANSSMNMSKDEMKQLIISTVEKAAPDQAAMIKQNIDQVMASGMIKFDLKETATYEIGDDGWVKSINGESTNESMGQSMSVKSTVTLQ